MDEAELKAILARGTMLVHRAAQGDLSVDEFLDAYGAFYYENALDGHEADHDERRLLATYFDICELHRKVQETVVDLVFRGDAAVEAEYFAAGRISKADACVRLRALVSAVDIEGVLRALAE